MILVSLCVSSFLHCTFHLSGTQRCNALASFCQGLCTHSQHSVFITALLFCFVFTGPAMIALCCLHGFVVVVVVVVMCIKHASTSGDGYTYI